MKRRSKAKKNPSGSTWLLLGIGATALGIGAYFLLKPSTTSSSQQLPPSRPFGDPGDPNSIAYACNTATKLSLIGHGAQAAPWVAKCQANGGTVPPDVAHFYT